MDTKLIGEKFCKYELKLEETAVNNNIIQVTFRKEELHRLNDIKEIEKFTSELNVMK